MIIVIIVIIFIIVVFTITIVIATIIIFVICDYHHHDCCHFQFHVWQIERIDAKCFGRIVLFTHCGCPLTPPNWNWEPATPRRTTTRGATHFVCENSGFFSPKLYQSFFFERKGVCQWRRCNFQELSGTLVFAWLIYLIQSAKNTMDGTILST